MTRCCPSPTLSFKTKQKPSASSLHTQPGPAATFAPPPPRRPPRLGPGPGSGELAEPRAPRTGGGKQTGRLGSGRLRAPSCHPLGSGGGAERGRLRALLGAEPGRAALQSCRRPPGQRLPVGGGGAEAARRRQLGESRCGDPGGLRTRPGKVPVKTPCLETPAALREELGGGAPGAHRGCSHPPVTPWETGQRPPQPNGNSGGRGWPVPGPDLLCMLLVFPPHSKGNF